MNVRDYILLANTDKEYLKEFIESAFNVWVSEWFCEKRRVAVTEAEPLGDGVLKQINDEVPIIVGNIENEWCAICLAGRKRGVFIRELFGEKGSFTTESLEFDSYSIVNGVVFNALTMLGGSIISGYSSALDLNIESEVSAIPGEAALNGSGVYSVMISVDNLELFVVLSLNLIERILQSNSRKSNARMTCDQVDMSTFSDALAKRKVSLVALLGSVELPISDLMSLNIGDVIQLDKPASESLEIIFPGTNVKCSGYLGKSAGRRAMRLKEN